MVLKDFWSPSLFFSLAPPEPLIRWNFWTFLDGSANQGGKCFLCQRQFPDSFRWSQLCLVRSWHSKRQWNISGAKEKWDYPGFQHRSISSAVLPLGGVLLRFPRERGWAGTPCLSFGRNLTFATVLHLKHPLTIAAFRNVCCFSARRIQIANFAAVQPSLLTVHLGE